MKKISIFLMIFILCSCKSNLEIISSIKQTVIPGIKTAKPYKNYIFKIAVKSDVNIVIDRVLVIENQQCLLLVFVLTL